MTRNRLRASLAILLLWTSCAPVMPQRNKPGGSARWALALAQGSSVLWESDARLCRVVGMGVGSEGWLPDRGGNWILTYWSPQRPAVLEVAVDSDGGIKSEEIKDSPFRGQQIPDDWKDSSAIWAATRPHQKGDPLNTFEVELSHNAEETRFPERLVWRIRFYLMAGGFESHVVTPQGEWLAQY